MKNVWLVLLASVATVAAKATTLNCVVPMDKGTPVISATVDASEESSGDFVTLTINEPQKSALVYFNQMEKGAFSKGIAEGSLVTLVVSESAKMENGAVKGAGFLVLQKDDQNPGSLSGFASINDTFYPLECK